MHACTGQKRGPVSRVLGWAAGLTAASGSGYTIAAYVKIYRKHILQDPGIEATPEAERKTSSTSNVTPVTLLTELSFLLTGKGKIYKKHSSIITELAKRINSELRGKKLVTGTVLKGAFSYVS